MRKMMREYERPTGSTEIDGRLGECLSCDPNIVAFDVICASEAEIDYRHMKV